MFNIGITYKQIGPIFSPGLTGSITDNFTVEAKQRIAQEGVNLVRAELRHVLKNPTGYYESNVVTDLSISDMAVTDSGVVYGPWLEGVGSRNRTTRFKGYFTFRRMGYKLQGRAADIAQQNMAATLKRLGG
jgi:hypothetical protein